MRRRYQLFLHQSAPFPHFFLCSLTWWPVIRRNIWEAHSPLLMCRLHPLHAAPLHLRGLLRQSSAVRLRQVWGFFRWYSYSFDLLSFQSSVLTLQAGAPADLTVPCRASLHPACQFPLFPISLYFGSLLTFYTQLQILCKRFPRLENLNPMLLNPCPCADRVNDVLAGNTVLSCSLLPYSPDAPLSSSQWWKASLGHHCSVPCPRSLELMNFPAQAQILSLQLSHLSQSLNL